MADAGEQPPAATRSTDWRAVWAAVFSRPGRPAEQRAFAAAVGEDHPSSLDPYGYTTWSELRRVADLLGVGPGQLLVDVGCGRGGPGVWLAARTGARLLGLDVTGVPLVAARRRAADHGVVARFGVGTFADTGLAAGEADAIVSLDALLFAADRAAALCELARVLRPGGRLVATTSTFTPDDDLAVAIASAGLVVDHVGVTAGWQQVVRATSARLGELVDELAAEADADPDLVRAAVARARDGATDDERRVLLVARRPTG